MNGYRHRFEKNLGGIKHILLTERNNIHRFIFDPGTDSYSGVEFIEPERATPCSFAEGAVSYAEDMRVENGIVSVVHTVEFVTDRMDEASRKLLSELTIATADGVVVIVTSRNDVRFVVGYSQESRGERPLKLAGTLSSSGKKHTDPCGESVTLRSYDGTKARIFTGSIG